MREAKESSIPGNVFSVLLPEHSCKLTWKEFMTWRLHDSTQNTSTISNTGYTEQSREDSRNKSNQNAYQLLAFKKGIKRKLSQYTITKDEMYFEAFKRHLLVTTNTHGCEEVLEEDYMPGYDDDCQELFQQSNTSCTVFSTKYSKVTWAKP